MHSEDGNKSQCLNKNSDTEHIGPKEQEATNSSFSYQSLQSVRKKLLDLSGRNQLLNYKHPKASCVRIIDELPNQIYEELKKGKSFSFIPVPDPSEEELIKNGYLQEDELGSFIEVRPFPSAEIWAKQLGLDVKYELPSDNGSSSEHLHNDKNIQTLMYSRELEARLRSIKGKSQTAVEESGSNVLYLVLGFLEWYESIESKVKRVAPLFTLPVQLERQKFDKEQGVYRYAISLKDEGILTNITLSEKLANDFNLALPLLVEDVSPEEYFESIRTTILKHKPNWKLHRMGSLAVLNFTKQVMYQDLDPENWPSDKSIEKHQIVQRFFTSSESDEQSLHNGFIEEYSIDKQEQVHDKFPLIYEADSSQHSALIDAVNNENLVIEGPPGSGKSQTITNLIASCIANGKKVLFVAEKMAALEVVKNRLDSAGLGDFCLELHSHKTNKKRLLDDLSLRLSRHGKYKKPEDIRAEIARFEALKDKLNKYASLVNQKWKNTGLTIFEILNKATMYREKLSIRLDNLIIDNVTGEALDPVRRRELIDTGKMLESIHSQVTQQSPNGDIQGHYWYGVNNSNLNSQDINDLIKYLKDWDSSIEHLTSVAKKTSEALLVRDGGFSNFSSINSFLKVGADLPDLIGKEPLTAIKKLVEEEAEYRFLVEEQQNLKDKLLHLNNYLRLTSTSSIEAPDLINKGLSYLKAFGRDLSASHKDISDDLLLLKNALKAIDSSESHLIKLFSILPNNLSVIKTISISGLEELLKIGNFSSRLDLDLLDHRQPLYDQDELDLILNKVKPMLDEVNVLNDELSQYFDTSAAPSTETLKELYKILSSSNILSLFAKDWWGARKVLRSLSNCPNNSNKKLISLLPEYIEFTKKYEALDSLCKSDKLMNKLYTGINTPIEKLQKLREWYKSVRDEYGNIFSDRGYIADEIFSMDKSIFLAFLEAKRIGLLDDISNIISSLLSVSGNYNNSKNINSATAPINESSSPFVKLSISLGKILSVFNDLVSDKSLSLYQINDLSKDLRNVVNGIQEWKNHCVVKHLGNLGLQLDISIENENKVDLIAFKNLYHVIKACTESKLIKSTLLSRSDEEQYTRMREHILKIKDAYVVSEKNWEKFSELGSVNQDDWLSTSKGDLYKISRRNTEALGNSKWIQNWLQYLNLRSKLKMEGMGRVLSSLESNQLSAEKIIDVINYILMNQLSKEILNENSYLSNFTGMEQMAIRERFCEYDKNLLKLQRQKIGYRAAQTNPPAGNASGKVSSYSEVALINHEAGKKTRHLAVRALIDRAGASIQALKPCFMMSPMSVAQYLKPGKFEFDIVVMDEASQIRPEDALGAIARGKSLVVVGDPKQLPPTSFFDKLSDEDSDEDSVALEESESILESVIPMFKTRRLRWHYRSRHESLIAFSNLHFYNSDLVIFPSPYSSGNEFGVHYHKVDRGRFSKGKNPEEARAIANAALNHMIQNPTESLGIVTMNSQQQTEVEMHIEELIKGETKYKHAFDQNSLQESPLFIKNLENVQGDERDVIMISMTYGPESVGGRVFQRFGPINKDVGWRRLNVLFTRSKKRMHVFSSMDSQDILVSTSSKKGVQSLRRFLEYCENGHLYSANITGKAPDSDFEISVMELLSEKGYECEPQLGVAGYYLDLAVKDPSNPGAYLMGIECDGATYHSAKSARDRDRLRQEVLESLGWRIRRIWSTDWFKNPEAQLQPILNELESLRVPNKQPITGEVKESLGKVKIKEAPLTVEDIQGDNDDSSHADKSLYDILFEYQHKVIRKEFPHTEPKNRLLRPAMIEILVNEAPTSKEEFGLKVPNYLRLSTDKNEAKAHLDAVLELISEYS